MKDIVNSFFLLIVIIGLTYLANTIIDTNKTVKDIQNKVNYISNTIYKENK